MICAHAFILHYDGGRNMSIHGFICELTQKFNMSNVMKITPEINRVKSEKLPSDES